MSENLKRAESLFNRIMNQSQESNGASDHKGYRSQKPSISGNNHGHQNKDQFQFQNQHHHNQSISHNPVLHVPARDPVKLSAETVQRIPIGHHVLPYCWTVWHHSRSRQRPREEEAVAAVEGEASSGPNPTVDSYLQTTNEISFLAFDGERTKSIGSIEQLWLSLSSIKRGFELPVGTELLVFKTGINPVWEDPVNVKGGRWVFRFNRRLGSSNGHSEDDESVSRVRRRTTLIWERLLLKTLCGSIIPESSADQYQDLVLSDISGLVMSVRKDEDIISVWNSNLNFQSSSNSSGKETKKLTSFQARRVICDSILRIIRECDQIVQGGDCVDTLDSGSSARVHGVSFDYRLHADNNNPVETKHHHHHREYHHRDRDQRESSGYHGNNNNHGAHYTPRRYKNKEIE